MSICIFASAIIQMCLSVEVRDTHYMLPLSKSLCIWLASAVQIWVVQVPGEKSPDTQLKLIFPLNRL